MRLFLTRIFLTLLIFGGISLNAEDHTDLKMQDIQKVMLQIFQQHVSKKEMTKPIIQNSFQVYIDQFDPDRVYLLESEVNSFVHMSDAALDQVLADYRRSLYPQYVKLNELIQKTILRSRKIRDSLESNISTLFQDRFAHSFNKDEELSDPDLKKQFPKTIDELNKRIDDVLHNYIAAERRRYGVNHVDARREQTIKYFEKQVRAKENQYLAINEDGTPMNENEKENIFALHVLKSLANGLDAHTAVMSPNEAYDMRVRLESEVHGIGVAIVKGPQGGLIVAQLVPGSPAAKSGLINVQDRLVEVNGVSVEKETPEKVMALIRGKKGTKVSLKLMRKGSGEVAEKPVQVQLVREDISVPEDRVHVSSEKFGTGIIGIIKLDTFYQSDAGYSSETDIREAIHNLDKNGNLRGLILDLRDNSGGFLSQAVKVAGLFITNGVVVISKYFNGEEHFYRDMDGKTSYDGPLIILTSKATASAAEIVAQALQDYGVAVIVGDEHTYGKGTIQSQTVTGEEGSTFFKVTVGQYYTVSGKTPQIGGVKADVVVPSHFLHENIGEEYLEFPLGEDKISSAYNDTLGDVSPNLKSWYMKYYVPTLQHPKTIWKNLMPTLKKNSSYRISQNQRYQAFLQGKNIAFDDPVKYEEGSSKPFRGDLQLDEGVNVMKDMIVLEMKERINEK
jgi:carboxyl-terminal processing protease